MERVRITHGQTVISVSEPGPLNFGKPDHQAQICLTKKLSICCPRLDSPALKVEPPARPFLAQEYHKSTLSHTGSISHSSIQTQCRDKVRGTVNFWRKVPLPHDYWIQKLGRNHDCSYGRTGGKKLLEEKEEKKSPIEERQSNMCPCEKLPMLNWG